MTNRTTKRALLTSVMALLLCFSMLLGTTYAWFTDSVTSSNNIIKAGNLDVAMYWADGTKAVPADDSSDWKDASTGAIFNYDLWEPGYAEVRHIKIANEGNLALKYKVNILANGEVSKLSDVIDVYYVDPAVQVADRALLTDSMKLGTLTEALTNLSQTGFGTLEAGAKDEITIAFKMQETAGNEYQGLSIGTDFAIQILATQLEYEEDSFDDQYDAGATYRVIVENENDLQLALEAAAPGSEIILDNDITVSTPIVNPAPTSSTLSLRRSSTPPVVIDLNGNTISANDTTYAFNNLGNLLIKDSVGTGSINARGIYNGYGQGGDNVSSACLVVDNVTINALGTNGGAAIYNYGIVEVNGGTFTSIGGYSLNNQSGASMTVASGVTANNGIYSSGATLTINGGEISGNRSGCHVVYAWNSDVTINGGTFYNYNSGNATVMAAGSTTMTINDGTFGIKDGRVPGNGNTWTSCLLDTSNSAVMTINGGTINGGVRVQGGTKLNINAGSFNDCTGSNYNVYTGAVIVIKGGIFTDDTAANFAKKYVAEGYLVLDNGDGTYSVHANNKDAVMSLKDGAVLDLGGVEFAGTVVAEGDLTIQGDTKIKTLKAINGGTITIEDGKTLTLNNFSFGSKDTAGAEYEITGGTIVAAYGFFQHGTYALYSDFETGYMYYSYGSDITVYGTFHSQGTGDGLDYVRGKLTVAAGGKSIHDKSLWVGQPAGWGAMNATLIVEEGGYVQANSLSVYDGSVAYNNNANVGVDGVGIKYNSISGVITLVD